MSLNKAIQSHKEHRKEYRKAKRVDKSCRNHGNCKWCEENRLHKSLIIKEIIKEEMESFNERKSKII